MQRYNVGIGAVLALLILVIAYFLGLPEGWPRLVAFALAVAVFFLCAFAWKPSKPSA